MSERGRRLDWTLLLPASTILPLDAVMVLGGTDEAAQSLVEHGVASSWRRPDGPEDRCGFVVAGVGCALDLGLIARHVEPGGLLYLEIDRRRRGRRLLGLGSVQRRLGRGGCQIFSAHLVTPNLTRPRRYLPMDNPLAIRWHLRTLFVAGTPRARLLRASLSGVLATPAAGAVLGLATMRYIVIGTSAHDHSAPLGVPMARGDERAIVVTSGYDTASRAVVLPFDPAARSPRFAVKVASSSRTTTGTLREHERLIDLHASLSRYTARALPRPLGLYTVGGRVACVQTCAKGPSMSTTVGHWGRRWSDKCRDLDVVVDWLNEFGAATRVDVGLAQRDWKETYGDARASIELSPPVMQFLSEAEEVARSTPLGDFTVHQHYDAGPWNVHINGAEPFLIDWESDDLRPADCMGPPLADVLYVVMYWYFLVTNVASESEEEAAIVRLFATPAPADRGVVAARAALDRALVCHGLRRQVVPAVLGALWAERAVYTHRRRAVLGVPLASGQTRPEAFLRALAAVSPMMCDMNGWWNFSVGTTGASP